MPTSNDLMNKHFEKASFGGYKAADVDEFMEDIRIFISEKSREIADLKKRLDAAEKKAAIYTNGEESIKNTLLNAQVLADKITKDANEKAEKVLSEATATAESTLRSAKIKAENLIDCAESEVDMRKKEAETIKTEVYNFKLNLMKMYRAQLELIHDIPAEDPNAPKAEDTEKETQEKAPKTPAEEAVKAPETEEKAEPSVNPALFSSTTMNVQNAAQVSREQENPPRTVTPMDAVIVEPQDVASKSEVKADDTIISSSSEKEEVKKTEDEAAAAEVKKEATPQLRTVKLNLRYNEKTGEYEPLGATHESSAMPQAKGKNGDGLKFGADYNIRTDSFERK